MHKKFLLCLLTVLVAFPAAAQAAADWQEINQDAKKHLIRLINIDTAQPNPNELAAARYIYKVFNKNHIDWDIFIPRKGYANIMARIKGTDPSKKPLLLLSHLDTVAASPDWSKNPFKATEQDGRIYGLGATDAKNYTAAYLALFTWLAQQKVQPQRDIIFLATSGEESGSKTGLLWLLGTHWKKINPGFALNEGGGVIRADNDTPLVFAEGASKQYMDVKITASGQGGHAAIPTDDNAVYRLSQALAKVSAYNPPAKITPVARNFFQAILPLQNEDGKTTIDVLLHGNAQNQQNAAEVMAQDPFFRSQLKDTVTPTELSASEDPNTTSNEASALLNIRLLPGTDPDEFLEQLSHLFAQEPDISLEVLQRPQTPEPPAMDGTDELFKAIDATAKKLLPGAITVNGMSPASSDSEFLRRNGVITYGLGPEMDPADENSAHNGDEFIRQEDFFNQIRFLAGVLFHFAYGGQELLPLTTQTNASAL